MATPKYLQIPKKIPYNIRLPKPLLDKLNSYAELTGNTTTDIVIKALDDFISNKVVYNDYLDNIKGISIKLPMISREKSAYYNYNLIDGNSDFDDLFKETYNYYPTSAAYEILKIPNNTDKFNTSFGYVTPNGNITAAGKHSGIEFVVIPEYYNYYENADNVIDALYCLYFEVETNKLKSIKLIKYLDAINIANDVGNISLKNDLITVVNELERIETSVDNGEIDSDKVIEMLEDIADVYNSGNIIPLGKNTTDAVVKDTVNKHPDLYDEFIKNAEIMINKILDEKLGKDDGDIDIDNGNVKPDKS